ncbi:hypothetical protein RSG06_002445 [Yersinia enterocolitica]|nr:hypothetical protein [Yersinia enterocolitica]
MSDSTEKVLISLLDEIIENADFHAYGIEPGPMIDFISWKERVIAALEKAKAKS